jgi:hypothetical protein
VFGSQNNNVTAPGFYVPQTKKVLDIPVGYYAAIFLLLSALDHLVVVLPGVNDIYNRLLARNQNPFRWAEYARERAAPGARGGALPLQAGPCRCSGARTCHSSCSSSLSLRPIRALQTP